MTLVAASGATRPPANGTWVLGVDSTGTAYLFKQGATNPSGQKASAAGLANWVSLGTSDLVTMSTRLGTALGKLGTLVTPVQASGLMQSVDQGSIGLHGASYVDIPSAVGPGAGPSQVPGGASSGSEAVASNIIPSPSIPGVDVGSILGTIWSAITTPAMWLRILEYVGGAILIYMGIRALTGVGPDVSDVAKVVK